MRTVFIITGERSRRRRNKLNTRTALIITVLPSRRRKYKLNMRTIIKVHHVDEVETN